jgi:hypothetical protein
LRILKFLKGLFDHHPLIFIKKVSAIWFNEACPLMTTEAEVEQVVMGFMEVEE